MTYSHSNTKGRPHRGGRTPSLRFDGGTPTTGNAASTATSAATATASEALEGRRLFATVALVDNILTIDGGGDDHLRAVVMYNPDTRLYRTRVSNAENQKFKRREVWAIHVNGTNGDDYIHVGSDVKAPATAYGRAGDDVIIGGRGNDWLGGGDGHDVMLGRWGKDHVYGGPGDDRLFGGHGPDAVEGAEDNDTLFGGSGLDEVYGHDGHDTLMGGYGDDEAYAGAGNDMIKGGRGDDMLAGGDDSDAQFGGRGADDLMGGSGLDQLSPGRNPEDHVDEHADIADPHYHNKHERPVPVDPLARKVERRERRAAAKAAKADKAPKAERANAGNAGKAKAVPVASVRLRSVGGGWTLSGAAA